ncbi:MAG: hypothetical protein GQ577_02545 [Woeseiaceae bacterium]|nr:hypothetical protein [Woeseiaceae bacterium]
MLNISESPGVPGSTDVSGEFLSIDGERYYAIRNVDRMPPFFISIASNSDHWLYVSSTGGLTAGRVSPETALFPYAPVDRIHECWPHTGSKTLVRIDSGGRQLIWEPFNREQDAVFAVTRNLYKNVLGNKLRFEEINHDLQLAFRYTWLTSDRFGFVRDCELENLGEGERRLGLVDGLQNLLPAGTPRHTQSEASNLVNAYKWSELLDDAGLAVFTLYSGISDRAEPLESLRANTVFCLGLDGHRVLLSSNQLDDFRAGRSLEQETLTRGVRGAYFACKDLQLAPGESQRWQVIADIEKSQAQVIDLRHWLANQPAIADSMSQSIAEGSDELARFMATADGFQHTAEENVTAHHYANVMFNVLRGGIFDDQYAVSVADVSTSIMHFNRAVYERHRDMLQALPDKLNITALLKTIREQDDPQLARLCYEYLPITFGRRHGDPSRPWNQFAIRLRDSNGNRLLSYEGNWRDIFQNWESLTFSYPEFIESVIAKFVNASTIDGYNPYRITKQGIDWEVEDPDNPWSHIGYWGDHQIVYLMKLLELSAMFHPARLARLLREPMFSYANVPYRIKDFDSLLEDPKNTVVYDQDLAQRITDRVEHMGADGKLVLDADGKVYQVNLLDKLLIPLLSKLGNLVVDGGIWLNTQRPEWNDANNALVGQGLSMVTLYYMRRYVRCLQRLIQDESEPVELSVEVTIWLTETSTALRAMRPELGEGRIKPDRRYHFLRQLGQAAERYRSTVYGQESFSGKASLPVNNIEVMLEDTLAVIDHCIGTNKRDDGLYHAYNLLTLKNVGIDTDALYPMLEGQVAVLSSGAIGPEETIAVLESLFDSDMFRADQNSFMLYPDRDLPGFLNKNTVPESDATSIPLLRHMLDTGDDRIIQRDAAGGLRFSADCTSAGELGRRLDDLVAEYGNEIASARKSVLSLYEDVFNHKAFTGRSGTMFGFEGLGSIYWHMVSKLMVAVAEIFVRAVDDGADRRTRARLGELYYRVRDGIGFNKSPAEYGAFPTDPYSHTPRHAGARQPGMTGQVKEELLSRYSELGVRVNGGTVKFDPALLRRLEFLTDSGEFEYLDVDGDWKSIEVPSPGLAFTWCQVPVVYRLDDDNEPGVIVQRRDGSTQATIGLELSAQDSREIFLRSGEICRLTVTIGSTTLLSA